ncbi:hypothetical protein G3A39_42985 [Paraburkholderia aspalathi]|nr:hypothetical protein [Paraburkholderia aspalathi]
MWAAGLKGDISPFRGGPTIGIEKTFSDIMDDLNFGGFVNIWARQDRFVFSADVMYVNTTDSETFGPLPSLLPAMPAGVVVEGSVDTKQLMAALQGGYRVYDTPNFMFDVLAGVRFWQISNKVTVNAGTKHLGLERSYEEKFGWADPIIGVRAFLPVTERLSVQAQADIGGFGVGSDLTWSTLATVNYIISDNFSLSAGYKLLDVDYRRGGHVYDTKLSGPVLGVTWRF